MIRWMKLKLQQYRDWRNAKRLEKRFAESKRKAEAELAERDRRYEEFKKNDWPKPGLPESYGYATRAKPRENVPQDEILIQKVKDILEAQNKCPTCGGELKHG